MLLIESDLYTFYSRFVYILLEICIHFTRDFSNFHPSKDRYASYPGRNRPLLDRCTMYTMPPRSAGMFIRSAAAYLLGKRNESPTTVFSPCRTVQNDEISTNQRFGSTGHSRQISTLRSAGRLRSVFRATRTLYRTITRDTRRIHSRSPRHTRPRYLGLLLDY